MPGILDCFDKKSENGITTFHCNLKIKDVNDLLIQCTGTITGTKDLHKGTRKSNLLAHVKRKHLEVHKVSYKKVILHSSMYIPKTL